MIIKSSYCCALAAATLALGIHSASAATVHVGTCHRAHVTYTTIQSAVDAALDGDTVAICPGTYAEQISITKNVSLKNVVHLSGPTITAHIVPPAGGLVANTTMSDGTPTAAQILVSATANVTGLDVDGTGNNNTSCNTLEMIGIYYKGGAGLIRRNVVHNQITPGHESCQNGMGILVENAVVGTDSVTIENNDVSNFDKNGIAMRLPGSIGTIAKNTVTGLGPTTFLAQNGILLRDSASANINSNTVKDLVYSPDTFGSAGIILYNVSPLLYQSTPSIQRNVVDNTQFGIVLDGAGGVDGGNMLQISSNTVSNSLWDGIELESDLTPTVNGDYINVFRNAVSNTTEYEGIDSCADNNTITRNTVTASTNWGIHLDSLCEQANGDPSGFSNTVSNNTITTACVGILSGPADGQNSISGTHYTNVTKARVFGTDDYSCTTAHSPKHLNKFMGKSAKRLAVSP